MMAPKISGETMPPILKPVVTKPNTLPNDPGGVISRTIMSREGMITPKKKPPTVIATTTSQEPRSTLPISNVTSAIAPRPSAATDRSEEHTSELQSHHDLVCRLLLE